TPAPGAEARVPALVARLGERSFGAREKTSKELVALGDAARPALKQALHAADAEVRRRARECLDAINRGNDPELAGAAARLLAARRPAGACEALLKFLPAADEAVEDEVLRALLVVGVQGGKVDPLLERAVRERSPAVR